MSRQFKKVICFVVALCLAALTALPAFSADPEACDGCKTGTFAGLSACVTETGALHVCEKSFPDARFREYVAGKFDKDGSGALSEAEAQAVTAVDLSSGRIADLTGIGYFSELTTLDCSDNLLQKLDLSANKKLTALNCSYNALAMLRLKDNTALTSLKAEGLAIERPYNKEKNSVDISPVIGQYESDYITAISAQDANGNEIGVKEGGGNIVFEAKNPLFARYVVSTGLSGAVSEVVVYVYPYEDVEASGRVIRTVSGRALISAKNFPDDAFRGYVRTLAAADGYTLSSKELAVKEINCAGMGIADLKGIELFTELTSLDCSGNRLAALDLSANAALAADSVKTGGQTLETLSCLKKDGAYTLDLAAAVGEGNAAHVVSVKAVTANGADAGASYASDKGVVTFGSEPARMTYQYRIPAAAKNLPDMDVTAALTVREPTCEAGTFNGSDAYVFDGKLHLCEKNFADPAFLAVVKGVDTDHDGSLSEEEAAAVTEITVTGGSTASLRGVEFFTSLQRLSVADNALTFLDLSKNTELTALNCAGNRLCTLDLSANEKLVPANVTVGKQTGKQLNAVEKDGKYSVVLGDVVSESGLARVTAVLDKNGSAVYDPKTGIALFASAPESPVTYLYDTGVKGAVVTVSVECPVKLPGATEHTHTDLKEVPAENATCEKDGHTAYYQCSCGKYFSDAAGKTEIPDLKLIRIPATGHNKATAYTAGKLYHWYACVNEGCGKMFDDSKERHTDADGDGKCDVCGFDKMSAGVLGDVDGDGFVTPADARTALRISVGLEKEAATGSVAYVTADVDDDNVVTPADARLILRASIRLEDLAKYIKNK